MVIRSLKMFAKATRNFLKEVDAGGNLISVSNLNDSDKLQLLSLVTKKKRYWCWQRPKYQFLSVTLGDVLTEDQLLSPVVVESDFVKYEGKFENHVSGSLETALGKVKLNVGGKGLVESQSSFGTLRKQEVDLQQLVRDSLERCSGLRLSPAPADLPISQQLLCSSLLESSSCCWAAVTVSEVSAMEDGNIMKDTSVVLEIPAATTIAYGIIELYVKQDGRFVFCLLHEKHGGFEQEPRSDLASLDHLAYREFVFMDVPDASHGVSSQDGLFSVLKQGTLPLERNFHPFTELPEPQQMALRNLLQVVLFDEELLVVLEQVCDDIAGGIWSLQAVLAMEELKHPQQQNVKDFLHLVGCRIQGDCPGPEDEVSNQKLFATAYFLVSALAEMPDNAVALLGICCKLQIIPILYHLLRALSDDGVCDLQDPTWAPLKDTERFGVVQRLFFAADINLEQEHSSVKASILKDPHIFPLILYITLNGLCALDREH
ncbi:gasdermin-E isoform X3 [Cavia porcellus]|uniref:gasdermin-E isoform X3 n=1 Tax=Cavia porcellus TaxID=10141 RepID=UPI002FE09776